MDTNQKNQDEGNDTDDLFVIKDNKRNLTLDVAKGLAILLMIFDHILGRGKIITSFHMPLFFLISGYLLKEETWIDTLKKKSKGLLLPYIRFSLLVLVVGFFKAKFYLHATWQATGNYLLQKVIDTCMARDIWLLWFLLALFVSILLYTGIRQIFSNRIWRAVAVILVFFGGYFLSQRYGSDNFYYLDQGMMATFFIAVGDLAKRLPWDRLHRLSMAGISLLAGMALLWMLGISYGALVMANRIYQGFPLCILAAVAGTYVVIWCSYYVEKIPLVGAGLIWCGQHTLEILCFANLFRQFCDWKAVCRGWGINSIVVMFLMQVGMILGLVLICDRIKGCRKNWKR